MKKGEVINIWEITETTKTNNFQIINKTPTSKNGIESLKNMSKM